MVKAAVSQEEMALRLRVRQPQVSRILDGKFGLRSRAAQRWCSEAGVPMSKPEELAIRPGRKELVVLLETIWDGTPEDAIRVSALLRAAADLRR